MPLGRQYKECSHYGSNKHPRTLDASWSAAQNGVYGAGGLMTVKLLFISFFNERCKFSI
jgi:hypothetical protein